MMKLGIEYSILSYAPSTIINILTHIIFIELLKFTLKEMIDMIIIKHKNFSYIFEKIMEIFIGGAISI